MNTHSSRSILRTALGLVAGTVSLLAVVTATEARPPVPTGTLIALDDGIVQGAVSDDARAFLGIPYVAPPLGALRWSPPVAPIPWAGVLDATSFSAACPQLDQLVGMASENEDCLYLNVWSAEPKRRRLKPVMVWFHGGSNTSGSTADEVPFPGLDGLLYDGRRLASNNDVVIVSVNYRLGVFGFFGQSQLAGEDVGYPYTGNQGLLDQRAALQWVQDNIAQFGGNPKRVTIFGESAGAFDVCAHMVSPGSRGLFRRVIGQSGACTVGVTTVAEGATLADQVADAVGCGAAADELDCLRGVAVADLLAASDTIGVGAGLGITVDGGFLTDDPRTLFKNGAFDRKVRYLLGANSDEGTLFAIGVPAVADEAEYLLALQATYGDLWDEIAAIYPVSDFDTPNDAFIRVGGDSALTCATFDLARIFVEAGGKAYVYNFNRVIPINIVELLNLGAFHGAEIPYVWGTDDIPTAQDFTLGLKMAGHWSTFAARGRPSRATGDERWRRYRLDDDNIQRLDTLIRELNGFRATECAFWSTVYDGFDGS